MTPPTGSTARTVPGVVGVLVRACHPGPVALVTGVTTALAVVTGRPAAGVVAVLVAVLTGQLGVGWANDWLDAERDARTGRQDKPLTARPDLVGVVRAAAVGALGLCVPLSFLSGWAAGTVHLVAVAAAWGYDLGLKATRASWLPYALAFGLLPAFVTLGLPGAPLPPAWAVAGSALLGVGAHLTNVLPDIADDLATGVRGLPQRLGPARSTVLAALALGGALAVLLLGPPGRTPAWAVVVLAGAGLAVVAVSAAAATGRALGRTPFRLTLVLAAVSVAVLLARGDVLAG